jgi:hypothetical protein
MPAGWGSSRPPGPDERQAPSRNVRFYLVTANVAAALILTHNVSGARQFWLAGRRVWTVNPSLPSTLTAPVFPPSKSPEARRWPVANS